jgi:hypothetical protein
VKVTLRLILVDVQNINEYLIHVLCLNEAFMVPDRLEYTSLNILVILLFSTEAELGLHFPNLKSLILTCVAFDDDIVSLLSKLSLLESVSRLLWND